LGFGRWGTLEAGTQHKAHWNKSMDNPQTIQFPQDVNTEPFTEMEAFFVYGLTNCEEEPFSLKQAYWVVGAARKCEWDAQGLAYVLALARRGGPDLQPFDASDDELEAEAHQIFDEGRATFLRKMGRLQ
jgi:hypothetical protein